MNENRINQASFLCLKCLIDRIKICAWEDVLVHNDIPQTNRQHPITQYSLAEGTQYKAKNKTHSSTSKHIFEKLWANKSCLVILIFYRLKSRPTFQYVWVLSDCIFFAKIRHSFSYLDDYLDIECNVTQKSQIRYFIINSLYRIARISSYL